MEPRFGIDPAPHEDLPSDIRFKLWLATLTPEQVEADRERGFGENARKWVKVARQGRRPTIQ